MTTIYIGEEQGVDATDTQGTEASPFKSLAQAYSSHGAGNEYQVRKRGDQVFRPAAKAALKKVVNYADAQRKKREAAAKRAGKDEQEATAVEAAIAVAQHANIAEDPSLPEATLIDIGMTDSKVIGRLRKTSDEPLQEGAARRVRVQGRVYRVAKQGGLMFVTVRRGLGLMQCLLSGQLTKTYDALTLARETSMEISGELWEVPPGLHAPLGRELHADYFRIIAKAPGGDESFTNWVPEDGDPSTLLNLRHLTLRHDKAAAVMFVRDALKNTFHIAFRERNIKKVSPPALVQTQVEGGATLFAFNYYGEEAFLTQSSQLCLETILPSLGDVYCIEKSFRAEKSLTRRHVSHFRYCLSLLLV